VGALLGILASVGLDLPAGPSVMTALVLILVLLSLSRVIRGRWIGRS
jgi:hypothetical protein